MSEPKDRWIAVAYEGDYPETEQITILRDGRVPTCGGRIIFTNVTHPMPGTDEDHAFDTYEEAEALADKVQREVGKVGKVNFPEWIIVDEIDRRLAHLHDIGLLEVANVWFMIEKKSSNGEEQE